MTEPVPKKSKLMKGIQKGNDDTSYGGNPQKAVELSDDGTMDHLEIKLVEESNQLLNLLPELVWLQVLDQLTNSTSDLEQISNASPYFRKLLLSKRVLFKFPLVLKLTLPHLLAIDRDSTMRLTVLRLRKVCKSWNKTADSFEQEKVDAKRLGVEMDSVRRNYMGVMFHYFYSCESVQLFMKHFEDTHRANCERSPFVIRDVEICFDQIERHFRPAFLNQVTNLLENYGHHIWNFRLTDSLELPYLNLRGWLMSLVNLKSLHFDSHNPDLRPLPGETEMRRLNAEIRAYPMPNFKALHTFDTYGSPLPPPLFNEIIRNCDQISTLHFGLRTCWRIFAGRYALVPLPNLCQLLVRFQSWDKFSHFNWARAGFTRPLTLSLSADTTHFVEWCDFFRCLQNYWGDVLGQLSVLEMPRPRNEGHCLSIHRDTAQFRLELPRLHHLELIIPDVAHLDFLLGTKDSLQSLKIEITADYLAAIKFKRTSRKDLNHFIALVQFRGYENRMLESNIWELFQNLDNLTVRYRWRTFEYTRADRNSL